MGLCHKAKIEPGGDMQLCVRFTVLSMSVSALVNNDSQTQAVCGN